MRRGARPGPTLASARRDRGLSLAASPGDPQRPELLLILLWVGGLSASAWSIASTRDLRLTGPFKRCGCCFFAAASSAFEASKITGRTTGGFATGDRAIAALLSPTSRSIRSHPPRSSAAWNSLGLVTVVGRYPTLRSVASTGTPASAFESAGFE